MAGWHHVNEFSLAPKFLFLSLLLYLSFYLFLAVKDISRNGTISLESPTSGVMLTGKLVGERGREDTTKRLYIMKCIVF